MDESQNAASPQKFWAPPGAAADPAGAAEETWRRKLRRRLLVLLCAMCFTFAVTTWLLVRYENPLGSFPFSSGPASVVRAQLDALNRGDLRVAYDLFSPEYREKVPFDAFRELVITHRGMFRTHALRIGRDDESGGRAFLETHLLSEGGRRYVVRHTLVRINGRWWVDDLHWGDEPNEGRKLRA